VKWGTLTEQGSQQLACGDLPTECGWLRAHFVRPQRPNIKRLS
jgi:hypothetical protein